MEHFQLRHCMSLRMKWETLQWLRGNPQGLPPATFATQLLDQLAQQGLGQKDGSDGGLRTGAEE